MVYLGLPWLMMFSIAPLLTYSLYLKLGEEYVRGFLQMSYITVAVEAHSVFSH